ncbi:Fic family protein [Pseudomonas sp. YuFO20]|uniref:Fic family protein n=1 Tax=Pseudomonas sp. YuFO20 TaxID=3095362 RepID=UPI002B24F144|nr:Fic family protein [Pseudomonas sp. YuFO20]MEB2517311.1 Fic family protein [Pseudomonas sp. YuFO20]
MSLITSKSWLDPILPDALPPSIIALADALPRKTQFLAGRLPPETAARLRRLLQITNTYYSNLIEGQYTEPADMQKAQAAPVKDRKRLKSLAVDQMAVQALFERTLSQRGPFPWSAMFAPELISTAHDRLFRGASDAERTLSDGSVMQPGALRSITGQNVVVGNHDAPHASTVDGMLRHLQAGFGRQTDPRRQLVSSLAYHHRLAWVHPFADGNGRVARLITHLQLVQLGLEPTLWSLSRGLARQHQDYYSALTMADRPREGDLDGRGQLSQRRYFEFIEFMVQVCHDQVDYMTAAVDPSKLRERVIRAFRFNEKLLQQGIRPESAPAIIALITQGSLPRNEIKTFTGLTPRPAIDELSRLIKVGLVESRTPKSRIVTPGLPAWFAQDIFPDLHRRFQ